MIGSIPIFDFGQNSKMVKLNILTQLNKGCLKTRQVSIPVSQIRKQEAR